MVYLISRHPGAVEWLLKNSPLKINSVHSHLGDNIKVKNGDIFIGTLPINLVEEITAKGARYIHLVIPIGQSLRGRELSKNEMDSLEGISLQEYYVKKVDFPTK